ncbi:uncharacterized protein Dere_GG13795 [Drosophila erecta]|uniref:Uncharacterized protein n=1 Tax=Drosophila erecta TaxID=7220 RepID=B3NCW8_DROER|nr:uncharacterized protein Dere_GG13795 [Drosophila erecta]
MGDVKTIFDIIHFAYFRILDILKENCERQNGDEPLAPLKYADIFNFAVSCQKFRRIVWDWSLSMYQSLEIDLLYVVPHKKITVQFEEIHKSLQGATKQKRDLYMDTYIKSMMGNSHLRVIKLHYNDPDYNMEHSSIFEEIVMGLQGKAKRITLDTDKIPKFKELIVDIAYYEIRNLHLFRNISKLILTASFAISDLKKFCINNPSLVYLEVNQCHFSDFGKLSEIVPHCRNLKNLKFLLDDNPWDNDYVGLSRFKTLRQLEIVTTTANIPKFQLPDKNEEWHNEFTGGGVHWSSSLQSISILKLLTALREKEKSTLIKLCIGFDIDDQLAQAIAKIKSLRMLECGFCDPKSIRHIARHPQINRISILSTNPLVNDDISALVENKVIVSNLDLKFRFEGSVLSCEGNDESFWLDNLEPFLKLKNLKKLILPVKTIVFMESTMVRFLEQGVKIICDDCDISLDPQERTLKIESSLDDVLPFSFPANLRCIILETEYVPTIQHLLHLSKSNFETLQELEIYTSFENDFNEHLNKAAAEALPTLKCLRKISCGFKKLIYTLPLAQLKDLESIVVLSEHHPKNVSLSRCLYPILRNCNKLSFFQMRIPVDGITKKFVLSLEKVVLMTRDQGSQGEDEVQQAKTHRR